MVGKGTWWMVSAWNEVKLLRVLQAVDTEAAHIVRFLESFQDSACTYLVFELLEQSLFEFQKKNNFSPLPVRHIRTIVAQVLVALAKLKELAIIHADLKPENIMPVDHAHHPFRVKLPSPPPSPTPLLNMSAPENAHIQIAKLLRKY
uniref:Protein kinase domain-containing protein n=1 Tax=Anser cygnoides TaxID=8845 RepID=A0A8B9ES30_ANSCY